MRIAMQPLPTLEPRRHERGYRGAFVPPQKRNLRWWSARTTRQGEERKGTKDRRKSGETTRMIEKDTHRVLLEILGGRGAETIQKGRNNERDRSSLKGYFSRNPWKGKGGREEEEADPQDSKNPSL